MTHLPPASHYAAPIVDNVATDDDSGPAWDIADDGAGPEEMLALAELHGDIERLRKSLPPADFALLAHHYGLDGNERQSLRELAPRLGIAHQAVHQRLERVLRRCKGILQDRTRRTSTH